ncbi:MAG: hypothetical protein H6Q85_2110, partial [candidate division NC10 bacterium]|nr:hypothetical protein [candidate division NC10 bacterium]
FRARAVVIGQALEVDGVAQGPVVSPANTFPFLPDVGEPLVGQTDATLYPDKSLVFRGCDAAAGWDAIAQDVPARVFGKFSTVEPELRAAVVLLRNVEISGAVVAFSDSASPAGRYLTIRTGSGDQIVFAPSDTPVFLEGDGEVPLDLVCTGTNVRVFLDPDVLQPTATGVKVVADLIEGVVTALPGSNTLLVLPAGQTVATLVHVRDGATIIDQRDDNYKLLGFADIKTTDQLKVFGLNASPCNTLFEAFVVLVVGP